MSDSNSNPFVSIASVVGGISLCMVMIFGVFAPSQFSLLPWIVIALAGMGLGLGYFASKA